MSKRTDPPGGLGSLASAALTAGSTLLVAAFAALMIVLVWRAWLMVEESWRLGAKSNTPLSTPLWIPQSIWLAGLIFCVVTLFLLFVRSLVGMARGDLVLVEGLSGPASGKDIPMADASGG